MSTNTGGREQFVNGTEVLILQLDGRITPEKYVIEPEPSDEVNEPIEYVRADRKGHVPLRSKNGKLLKIHFRRIIPLTMSGMAPVIESNDKYRAICPDCGNVFDVTPNVKSINCSTDGEFQLSWLGAKPMTTETNEATVQTETASTTNQPENVDKPTPEKKKPVKEAVVVDFEALKKLEGCELWTKKNIKFDHPEVDVSAHVLLLTTSPENEASRKYCFNTYNNALGKKAKKLYVEEFIAGTMPSEESKTRWFSVKDVAKERERLTKNGYELQN